MRQAPGRVVLRDEASPAFDPALPVKEDVGFPLLWFGLFRQVDEITLPCEGQGHGVSIDWHPSVSRGEYDRCIRDLYLFNSVRGMHRIDIV